MSHRSRRPRRRDQGEPVDMFPFLSVLLCVVGVLAFIHVLMTTTIRPSVRMLGDINESHRHAYQVLCRRDGIVWIPTLPSGPLAAAAISASPEARPFAVVRQKRCQQLKRLAQGAIQAEPVNDAQIAESLRELQDANRLAKQNKVLYEEFLLIGIYPGGGPCYHRLRKALNLPGFADLNIGLQPMSPQARPAVQSCPSEQTGGLP